VGYRSSATTRPIFDAHAQLAEEIASMITAPVELERLVAWHLRFMAIKAKYLAAAWSFIGRLSAMNSSNGACERTQSIASINLTAFRRGRLGSGTLSGLVALAESGDRIMPYVGAWLSECLPYRTKPALNQADRAKQKSAKRDLTAPR
jgi:hypothetical protein